MKTLVIIKLGTVSESDIEQLEDEGYLVIQYAGDTSDGPQVYRAQDEPSLFERIFG